MPDNTPAESEVLGYFQSLRNWWRWGGLAPENIPDYKALVGDTSDNLPGVPGIGDVSATAVLEKHGNLDEVYEDLYAIS